MSGQKAGRTKLEKVESLLNPKNVVIAGATDKAGNWTPRVWRNLNRYKYPRPIYPLNPTRDSIWDVTCYRSFEAMPEKPDHVVVMVPASYVPSLVRDAAKAGARSATVITSGFGELPSPEAQQLGRDLEQVVAETDIALSGPNCLGNFNASALFFSMPDDRMQQFVEGPVAIVAQSGGIVLSIKRTLEDRGIAVGALVTSGNETGLTAADYISYYATLPHIRVIVAYLEAIHEPADFLEALRAARDAGKPVVIFKLGASDEGRAAAAAHTGALAGSMEAFDAVAGAAGALRVKSIDDMIETVEFLIHAPPLTDCRLAGITYSGGMRGMIVDAGSGYGLKFHPMSAETRTTAESFFNKGAVIDNPLDGGFGASGGLDAFMKCVELYLNAPEFDMLLMQEELPREAGTVRTEKVLRMVDELAGKARKPVAFISIASYGLNDYARQVRAELPNLVILQEPDKALRAIRNVADYWKRASEPDVAAPPSNSAGKGILEELLAKPGPASLDEVSSKRLLAAYGVASTREELATSEDTAVAAAERIGYPVVAKIVSADIPHKSDMGGVVVGLKNADEVRAAHRRIMAAAQALSSKPKINGVLIAEMVSGGLELVLGASRDREMGPVILFGSGGVDIKLTRDFALAPPPLDERRAADLIAKTRAGVLVKGYRGKPPLDHAALVRALVGLSRLMNDTGDRIESIDVNPFLLKREGGVALDGLVIVKR